MKDLKPNGSGYNLIVRVNSVFLDVRMLNDDGESGDRVIGLLLSDETGSIEFLTEDIFTHLPTSATLILKNAHTTVEDGFIRLALSKWGSCTVKPGSFAGIALKDLNSDNNLSEIKHELVENEPQR